MPRWILPDLCVRQPAFDPEVGQGAAPAGPGDPGGAEGVELQAESGGAETEGEPAESGRQRPVSTPTRQWRVWVQTAGLLHSCRALPLCEALIDVQTRGTPTLWNVFLSA